MPQSIAAEIASLSASLDAKDKQITDLQTEIATLKAEALDPKELADLQALVTRAQTVVAPSPSPAQPAG